MEDAARRNRGRAQPTLDARGGIARIRSCGGGDGKRGLMYRGMPLPKTISEGTVGLVESLR